MAILAEKYAVDYSWYVDTILNLIRIAGDYVSEEVWYRVLQIVTNRDDVQGYAAKTVFEVSTPSSPPSRGLRAEKGQLGLWSQPALATILLPPPQSSALASLLLPSDSPAFTGPCEGQPSVQLLVPRSQHFPSAPEKGPILSCFATCVSSGLSVPEPLCASVSPSVIPHMS